MSAAPARAPLDGVGAAIFCQGQVLVAQRSRTMSAPGCWEFPGGKVEPGETPEQALRRELQEELGVTVQVGPELLAAAPLAEEARIRLRVFRCELLEGMPRAREHARLRWLAPDQLRGLRWARPDLPFVHALAGDLAPPG